jgi:hypothetical protein
MAEFIDEREEEVAIDEGEELENFDASEEEEEHQEEVAEPEYETPEKYRNKEAKDIIAMHQNAEKLLGKQSQEVGELRKVVDDFIQTQTIAQQQQPTASTYSEDEELDFFDDPKAAVAQMLENHPSVKQSRQMSENLAKEQTMAHLNSMHPDFKTILASEDFQTWVGKSKVRTKMLREADTNYDFDSADELFTTWKERTQIINDVKSTETVARKQSVRSASTGTAKGSGERSSKKIYRRADIVELMQKDPNRYAALASEIRSAYAEGRVR